MYHESQPQTSCPDGIAVNWEQDGASTFWKTGRLAARTEVTPEMRSLMMMSKT
jgi:hypothetical protein